MSTEPAVGADWLDIIRFEGDLDAFTAPQLSEAVGAALDRGVVWLVVDLTQVSYIDSVGLGILIGGAKRAGERGGDLAVASARRNIRKVFDVSGTTEMLNATDDVAQAVECLRALRASREAPDAEAKGGEAR